MTSRAFGSGSESGGSQSSESPGPRRIVAESVLSSNTNPFYQPSNTFNNNSELFTSHLYFLAVCDQLGTFLTQPSKRKVS